MPRPHSELVEFAKSRLTEWLGKVAKVDLGVTERETAELENVLDALRVQYERDGQPKSGQGSSLLTIEFAHAWRRGLSPDGAAIAAGHAYLEMLEDLGDRCATDPVAFDALARHASDLIDDDKSMPSPLRRFVRDLLIGTIDRPRQAGRPRKTGLPDLAIAAVVEELIEIHGLTAVGSVATEHEGSACAIVAEAMGKLRRQPSSFSAIEKIWFAFKREEGASRD